MISPTTSISTSPSPLYIHGPLRPGYSRVFLFWPAGWPSPLQTVPVALRGRPLPWVFIPIPTRPFSRNLFFLLLLLLHHRRRLLRLCSLVSVRLPSGSSRACGIDWACAGCWAAMSVTLPHPRPLTPILTLTPHSVPVLAPPLPMASIMALGTAANLMTISPAD